MGRAVSRLSRRRLRLSRGPRRFLPGESLACRWARRRGCRRWPRRQACLGSCSLASAFLRGSLRPALPAWLLSSLLPPQRQLSQKICAAQPAPPCEPQPSTFCAATARSERPDLIVVDPPRTGLGTEITTLLAGIGAPALTYVSCDPATLARDLRALLATGYAIQSLTLADLFPQTFHWRQWSTCAAPDRLDPIDPFYFRAQCNPNPPPPEQPCCRPERRAAVPCRMALCSGNCRHALALAAAQPGADCAGPGRPFCAAWRPCALSASPGCRWRYCGACWAPGVLSWSRIRPPHPASARSPTGFCAPLKEPSWMPGAVRGETEQSLNDDEPAAAAPDVATDATHRPPRLKPRSGDGC